MQAHDVCKMFPEMSDQEFNELRSDIARNGLIEPIWTYQGEILDGRNRYRACCLTAKPIASREWDGEGGSLTAFVLSQNLYRRNLTKDQRATIAAEAIPRIEEEQRERIIAQQRESGKRIHRGSPSERSPARAPETFRKRDNESRKIAGRRVGVGERHVGDAKRLKENSPEEFEKVKSGEKTLREAVKSVFPAARPEEPTETILIPKEPIEASREILKHFSGDRLHSLLEELANHAGFNLVPKC